MADRSPVPVLAGRAPGRGAPLETVRSRQADSVLSVTLDVLRAMATGSAAEDAICAGLATELDAQVAAYVALTPAAGTASLVAWPRSLDLLGLELLVDQLPAVAVQLLGLLSHDRRARALSTAAEPLGWRHAALTALLEEVLGCRDVAHLPLDLPGPDVRLLVLARRRRFDPGSTDLLDALRRPLTDILSLAGRSPGPPRHQGPGPAQPEETEPPTGSAGLTDRELQVLRLMAQGLLARTIALRLDVSPRTVHKHVGNIYRKLQVHDRLVAVRRAERLGLLGAGPPAAALRPPLARPADRPSALTIRW